MLVKAESYIYPSCWFVINIWYLPNKWVAVFRPEGRWELKPLSSNEHLGVPSAAIAHGGVQEELGPWVDGYTEATEISQLIAP